MSTPPSANRRRFALTLRAATALLCLACARTPVCAELISLPLEHSLNVQLIQTGSSSGAEMATDFGTPAQRAAIEGRVNEIWAQAGIRVNFESQVNRLLNNVAYKDAILLDEVIAAGKAAGVESPESSTLNIYLVGEPPGEDIDPDEEAAYAKSVRGKARVSGNGISMFIGDWVLSRNYTSVIGEVVAHEIGHNLGMLHSSTPGNLMATGSNGGDVLEVFQVTSVLMSNFLHDYVGLAGDFNYDGAVNAADYVEWRNGLGTIYTQQDYHVWRNNYGATASAPADAPSGAAPEPAAVACLVACLVLAGLSRSLPSASPRSR